jgi:hypothetical protein
MRLNSTMSREEVRAELERAAETAWGKEKLARMQGVLIQAANALWSVLQTPLDPFGEEPDTTGPQAEDRAL